MLWWIVDNLYLVLIVLGVFVLCFGAAWWSYRKGKLLLGVAVPGALMLLAWALSLFIVTDQMQLTRNVENMRDLINNGKIDDALDYFDDDIVAETMNGPSKLKKTDLKALTSGNMRKYGVKRVVVNQIDVEEVSRPNALVSFYVGPEDGAERGLCKMGFVLSPDGKWRVRTFTVLNVVGGQKLPLLFPF